MVNQELFTSSGDFLRLCRLLEQKIAIFKDFMSATVSLKDMILEHNAEAVELLIDRRHGLITTMNRIDGEILRIREEKSLQEVMRTPEGRKCVQSLTKNLDNIINRTMRLNQECEVAAENELDTLRNDLTAIGQSRTWFKGYKNSWQPRFLDVKT